MSAEAEIEKLRLLFPDVELWEEGDVKIAFLPRLTILNRGKQVKVAAILWPRPRDSYPTRLFLDRQLTAAEAKNWNAFTIAGNTWWACSWNGVPETLPWSEILVNHLRAFQ